MHEEVIWKSPHLLYSFLLLYNNRERNITPLGWGHYQKAEWEPIEEKKGKSFCTTHLEKLDHTLFLPWFFKAPSPFPALKPFALPLLPADSFLRTQSSLMQIIKQPSCSTEPVPLVSLLCAFNNGVNGHCKMYFVYFLGSIFLWLPWKAQL